MKQVSLEDCLPVLKALSQRPDLVLVGGQACFLYATKYQLPDLDKLAPLTSVDIDFLGNPETPEDIAQELNLKLRRSPQKRSNDGAITGTGSKPQRASSSKSSAP